MQYPLPNSFATLEKFCLSGALHYFSFVFGAIQYLLKCLGLLLHLSVSQINPSLSAKYSSGAGSRIGYFTQLWDDGTLMRQIVMDALAFLLVLSNLIVLAGVCKDLALPLFLVVTGADFCFSNSLYYSLCFTKACCLLSLLPTSYT